MIAIRRLDTWMTNVVTRGWKIKKKKDRERKRDKVWKYEMSRSIYFQVRRHCLHQTSRYRMLLLCLFIVIVLQTILTSCRYVIATVCGKKIYFSHRETLNFRPFFFDEILRLTRIIKEKEEERERFSVLQFAIWHWSPLNGWNSESAASF